MEKVCEYLRTLNETLEEEVIVDKKLLLFEFLTVFLCGIVLGLLAAPFRSVEICSNNENIGCNED